MQQGEAMTACRYRINIKRRNSHVIALNALLILLNLLCYILFGAHSSCNSFCCEQYVLIESTLFTTNMQRSSAT